MSEAVCVNGDTLYCRTLFRCVIRVTGSAAIFDTLRGDNQEGAVSVVTVSLSDHANGVRTKRWAGG